MKCADPVLCYTVGEKRLFRNFRLASPVAKQFHDLVFNCGKCIFCRKKRAFELAVRCVLHASLYKENCFLTLTYDEKKPGYHNNFQYEDIQKFKKKLRRFCEYNYQRKIDIFNVHEYGKKGKKHWHLVVFNWDFTQPDPKGFTRVLHTMSGEHRLFKTERLEWLWPHGFSSIGDVTEASAMYQAQYSQKDFRNGNVTNDKKSHSKHSGIGKPYFLKHYKQILSLGYIPFESKKIPIPRYFHKIAHKHYSHFYDSDAFFDLPYRKRLYTPFKPGEENLEIAELFDRYLIIRKEKIDQLTLDWEETINKYIFTNEKPDFMISAENYLYDLKNKLTKESF